jgi:hypothetical protein
MFDSNSRYYGLPTFTVPLSNGGQATLVQLRIIPPTVGLTSWQVTQADRPDLVAQHYYKDPTRFWRIADANEVLDPAESFSAPGAFITIPTRS